MCQRTSILLKHLQFKTIKKKKIQYIIDARGTHSHSVVWKTVFRWYSNCRCRTYSYIWGGTYAINYCETFSIHHSYCIESFATLQYVFRCQSLKRICLYTYIVYRVFRELAIAHITTMVYQAGLVVLDWNIVEGLHGYTSNWARNQWYWMVTSSKLFHPVPFNSLSSSPHQLTNHGR